MKIMVVFDSFFGNTEKIAEAVGKTLQPAHSVTVARACKVSSHAIELADALIVGSPTRRFRPSEATQEFLKYLPAGCLNGKRAAAFDTRISGEEIGSGFLKFLFNMLGTYASKPIAHQLVKKGALPPIPSEGFYVSNDKIPHLKDGEMERALEWVKGLFPS